MPIFSLDIASTILLIVDMQEKLFSCVDRGSEVLQSICKVAKGFQLLSLPIFISEQYPQGLGSTVTSLQTLLGEAYHPMIKSSFSCLSDPELKQTILSLPYSQWVVVGIEAHVCVLQTVKDLLLAGRQVTVLNDAITSRSIFDFSTSIAEMRDMGARISSVETILFELLKDAKHPQFKSISKLIKNCCSCSNTC